MIYFIGAGPGAADLITVKVKSFWKRLTWLFTQAPLLTRNC